MTSLIQCQEVMRLSKLNWQSVGYHYSKDETEKMTCGGPVTMINDEGDVLKVYASGDKILVKANDWDNIGVKYNEG